MLPACLGVSLSSSERGLSLESGNAPSGVSELLWGHSCAAVLNRRNIQRVWNRNYNSWKEITLQLELGAPHSLTVSEGGFFGRGGWRRDRWVFQQLHFQHCCKQPRLAPCLAEPVLSLWSHWIFLLWQQILFLSHNTRFKLEFFNLGNCWLLMATL